MDEYVIEQERPKRILSVAVHNHYKRIATKVDGSTSPLAYLTSTIGWSTSFIFAGAITTLLALLVWWVLKGETREDLHSPKAEIGILESARLVVGSVAFWQISSVATFSGTERSLLFRACGWDLI